MQPQPNDLKAIRIVYFALLIGQLIFATIVTVLIETDLLGTGNPELTPFMQVAVIVIAISLISASFFIFRKRLAAINPEEELGKKLELYRAALIVRMALCEGPVLFAIISYFVTHDRSFLWMTIILISNFLFIYPSKDKIINQLQLNGSEQSVLGLN